MSAVRDELVWIDCEMTGLDLGSDKLIEIAALVTDGDLNILGDGVDVVIHADDAALAGDDRRGHRDARQVRADRRGRGRRPSTWPPPRRWCSTTSASHVKQAKTAPLAGNSIATDRGFIARDMPALDDYLHYRMIDVSSIKELCRRWYPRIYFGQPEKGLAHRALADIHESIRELRVLPAHRVRGAARAVYQRYRGGRGRTWAADAPDDKRFGRRAPQAASIDDAARCSGGDGGCSSVGRAPGCDPGCRGFESRQPPR